jgi:hypothetical protein
MDVMDGWMDWFVDTPVIFASRNGGRKGLLVGWMARRERLLR